MPPMQLVPNRHAAFFQAGHAVGAHLFGIPVIKVSIVPADGADSWIEVAEPVLPSVGCFVEEQDRTAACALIIALLSGPAVGQRYSFGECGTPIKSCRGLLAHSCVWRAMNLARRFGSGGGSVELLWRSAAQVADENNSWSAVQRVAMQLLDKGEIDRAQIERVISN